MFEDYVFSWAENAAGQMVHIENVPNGLQCGCHCPHCKEPLLARHGDVKAHGFAHHSKERKATLKICYQVILYKVAEHIVQTEKRIHAPSYYGIFKEQDIFFKQVNIDGQYERADKQPDVVAVTKEGVQYLIEFTFSHKVQHKKPIDYQNMNCLEVDLEGQSLESLRKFLLNSNKNRKWVNNQQYFSNIEEIYRQAKKHVRITQESTCSKCPINYKYYDSGTLIEKCAGVKVNSEILKIENNGNVFRLCKIQEYKSKLKEYHEEQKKKAEQERIKKMTLEEKLLYLSEQKLVHYAIFPDGKVKYHDQWSSKDLHKKWYDDSLFEFTADAGSETPMIAAAYVYAKGVKIKDCLICQYCLHDYCSLHMQCGNAIRCRKYEVSHKIARMATEDFKKWVVET